LELTAQFLVAEEVMVIDALGSFGWLRDKGIEKTERGDGLMNE